jgi:molecular chaperone GrpE
MSKEEKKMEDGVNENTVNQEQEVSENARLNDSFGQENTENVVESVELNPMEKLQADYNELNDKFLRLFSEFDNFRKRTQREKLDIIKSGGSDVMKSILPVIDDFERAAKANENNQDPDSLKSGFNLIHTKFEQILLTKGLKRMDLIGTDFNSDISEAIANVPVTDASQKGKVIDIAEQGYYLNEVIIRFAKVVVGN